MFVPRQLASLRASSACRHFVRRRDAPGGIPIINKTHALAMLCQDAVPRHNPETGRNISALIYILSGNEIAAIQA
jgi:hypothetical protein